MDLDPAVAAKWCKRHKVPAVSPEVRAELVNLAQIIRGAIEDAPDIPPPEVRVYYQSMKFVLAVAGANVGRSRK